MFMNASYEKTTVTDPTMSPGYDERQTILSPYVILWAARMKRKEKEIQPAQSRDTPTEPRREKN